MQTEKPAFPLTFVRLEDLRQPDHGLAIYYSVVFVDSNGKEWKTRDAHFTDFDFHTCPLEA